jgi:hypothetical protein
MSSTTFGPFLSNLFVRPFIEMATSLTRSLPIFSGAMNTIINYSTCSGPPIGYCAKLDIY